LSLALTACLLEEDPLRAEGVSHYIIKQKCKGVQSAQKSQVGHVFWDRTFGEFCYSNWGTQWKSMAEYLLWKGVRFWTLIFVMIWLLGYKQEWVKYGTLANASEGCMFGSL